MILWDHPRLCGDYKRWKEIETESQGSPPPVRGLQCSHSSTSYVSRITPACAGTTHGSKKLKEGDQDHPRLCGDYVKVYNQLLKMIGSPPPVRGLHGF